MDIYKEVAKKLNTTRELVKTHTFRIFYTLEWDNYPETPEGLVESLVKKLSYLKDKKEEG